MLNYQTSRFVLVILLAAFASTMLLPRDIAVLAQTGTATPGPLPPEMLALQTQVSAQATQISDLEKELATLQITINVVALVITVVTALGITLTAVGAFKYAYERTKKLVDQAIYKIDPASAVIRVPKDGFDTELKHLKWRGFHKIREYTYLDKNCTEDCVVVVAKTEDNIADFRAFLSQYHPSPDKVAYVIYTQLRVPPEIVNEFPNITFANSPMTLGTNVYTIARSLIR